MAAAGSVLTQQPAPTPGMTMPMKPGATAFEGSMMSATDKMSKESQSAAADVGLVETRRITFPVNELTSSEMTKT